MYFKICIDAEVRGDVVRIKQGSRNHRRKHPKPHQTQNGICFFN
jgi:hypothetical protein